MENNWIKFKLEVRDRFKLFALNILELSKDFPVTTSAKVINYQLTKSGTSSYANLWQH